MKEAATFLPGEVDIALMLLTSCAINLLDGKPTSMYIDSPKTRFISGSVAPAETEATNEATSNTRSVPVEYERILYANDYQSMSL